MVRLQFDEQLRHGFTLRFALCAHAYAVHGIIDAVQRAQVIHDDEHVGR